jgi:hypothetical protein
VVEQELALLGEAAARSALEELDAVAVQLEDAAGGGDLAGFAGGVILRLVGDDDVHVLHVLHRKGGEEGGEGSRAFEGRNEDVEGHAVQSHSARCSLADGQGRVIEGSRA